MNDVASFPIGYVVTRFIYEASQRFDRDIQSLELRYKASLLADFRANRIQHVTSAPKFDFSYPDQIAKGKPVGLQAINEQGIYFQLMNGTILSKLEDPARWAAFVAYFDRLLACYEEVFESPCHEYLVQTHTILKLKKVKNYTVMSRLVPELASLDDAFAPLHSFGEKAQIERTDFKCTFSVPHCELIFDLQAPANENNSTLWIVFTCKTPQEELADQATFRLSAIESFLHKGQEVLANILRGYEFSLVGGRHQE